MHRSCAGRRKLLARRVERARNRRGINETEFDFKFLALCEELSEGARVVSGLRFSTEKYARRRVFRTQLSDAPVGAAARAMKDGQ